MQPTAGTPIGLDPDFVYARGRYRLGFGCASLMRIPSRRGRQAILGEAFEQGIRHFDVARMYGLGAAEGELGRFIADRRDQITLATKFGIEPTGSFGRLARVQAPARALIARFPALRARLKRKEGSFHVPRHYEPSSARASLVTSLRELKTDYVDVLFIHDPAAIEPAAMEDIVGGLETFREEGLLRSWGVSGEVGPSLALADHWPQCIPQLRFDIFSSPDPRPQGEVAPIYFGVLARALGRIRDRLLSDAEMRDRWREEIGLDCGDAQELAGLLIQDALERNREGGVIFATTHTQRIGKAIGAATAVQEGAVPASLAAFRRVFSADWGASGV